MRLPMKDRETLQSEYVSRLDIRHSNDAVLFAKWKAFCLLTGIPAVLIRPDSSDDGFGVRKGTLLRDERHFRLPPRSG
jgi:hypothetical protein